MNFRGIWRGLCIGAIIVMILYSGLQLLVAQQHGARNAANQDVYKDGKKLPDKPMNEATKKRLKRVGRSGKSRIDKASRRVVPADGAEAIFPMEATSCSEGRYSPDGTKFAFICRSKSASGNSRNLWVWSSRSSKPTGITNLTGNDSAGYPAWTPSGKYIVFEKRMVLDEHNWTVRYGIFKVSASGGGQPVQVMTSVPTARQPALSVKGKLAFIIQHGTGDDPPQWKPGLYVADDLQARPRLVAEGDWFDPYWFPNGRYLACSYLPPKGKREDVAILVVDCLSGYQRRLCQGMSPAVSRDGKLVAFRNIAPARTVGEETRLVPEIFVIPASGGSPVQITRGIGVSPEWASNGKAIVFVSYRSGPARFFHISLAGGDLLGVEE